MKGDKVCGIAGLAGGYIAGIGNRMNDVQRHRGPDSQGVFEDAEAGVVLAHVRLSILDLSDAASQPMYSQDRTKVLVFNGEIYNFKDLRSDLKKDGFRFSTNSDTEVLLHGLTLYGLEFVKRLNGIFAFAFWDRAERRLILVRDHLGVKPLYYAELPDESLVFASEIKALFVHPLVPRAPDFGALQEHLVRGHSSGSRTAFAGVFRLPPAGILVWTHRTRKWHIDTYWRPKFTGDVPPDYESAVVDLRKKIENSVKRQMVADVPVGSFLSGGLDSSLITKLATRATSEKLCCFTISSAPGAAVLDKLDDDLIYARKLATDENLDFEEIRLEADIVKLLPNLIWHMDEPIADPAIISCYEICKHARARGVKVILSGQGADELFGGYARYKALFLLRSFGYLPMGVRKAIARMASCLPGSMPGMAGIWLRRIRRLLIELPSNEVQRFMALASASSDDAVFKIFNPEIKALLGKRDSAEFGYELMRLSRSDDGHQFIYRDIMDYLPNHNLLYTDKMGMAVGLEARVPLLDMELVEAVLPMSFSWKVSKTTTKRILRDSSRTIIPNSIIDRPKIGFSAPYRKWLRDDLHELWKDVTSEETLKKRGWFDHREVSRIREQSIAGSDDYYMLQWAIMTCELWAREFLDKPATKVAPEMS